MVKKWHKLGDAYINEEAFKRLLKKYDKK